MLDNPGVPRYVVEAVRLPRVPPRRHASEIRDGKPQFHTPEFRRRERLYRNLTKAERWIGENLPELLRARQALAAAKRPRKRRKPLTPRPPLSQPPPPPDRAMRGLKEVGFLLRDQSLPSSPGGRGGGWEKRAGVMRVPGGGDGALKGKSPSFP